MNIFLSLFVITVNVLGTFEDPFEFEGDYGSESNLVRKKVFERVIPNETTARNLTDEQIRQLVGKRTLSPKGVKRYRERSIKQAIQRDASRGPLFSELITEDLIEALEAKQRTLEGFTTEELEGILYFLKKYENKKTFYFLKNCPQGFLRLDKQLRDKASIEGEPLRFSILSSTQHLKGKNGAELKQNLLDELFVEEVLVQAESEAKMINRLSQLEERYLKKFLGSEADNRDLEVFCSPSGQVVFYWIYQSLNLDLIAEEPELIPEINRVKEIFSQTIGNAHARAEDFKAKVLASEAGIVFTQEANAEIPQKLVGTGGFHSVEGQNPKDGCFIFLKKGLWEKEFQLISIDGYDGFQKGRLNVILAISKHDGTPFLLASCHGNSNRAEDGRLQISLVMEKYHEMVKEYPGLQVVIGIDANTKTERDVQDLFDHLDSLGLIATNVGPTTVKKRMVTVQHHKSGKLAIDQEDFIITLSPSRGGKFSLVDPGFGFNEKKLDLLPNSETLSDHYPVGVHLKPVGIPARAS